MHGTVSKRFSVVKLPVILSQKSPQGQRWLLPAIGASIFCYDSANFTCLYISMQCFSTNKAIPWPSPSEIGEHLHSRHITPCWEHGVYYEAFVFPKYRTFPECSKNPVFGDNSYHQNPGGHFPMMTHSWSEDLHRNMNTVLSWQLKSTYH